LLTFEVDVSMRYTGATGTITGSDSLITYTTKVFDTYSKYASGLYTVPFNGKYNVNAALLLAGTFLLNSNYEISIYKNGVQYNQIFYDAGGAISTASLYLSDGINCIAGDTIGIEASTNATTPTISSTATRVYLYIYRLPIA